jgi:protein MpaA
MSVWLVAVLLWLGGCGSSPSVWVGEKGAASSAVTAYHRQHVAGYSVERREIVCHTLGTGRDVTMILATIHGNEHAGTPIAERLVEHLRGEPAQLTGKRVVIVPVANPDGYHYNQRGNANGVDLNRNFSAANRRDNTRNGQGMSEPESRVIARLMEIYQPARIVSIHQPFNVLDYDGPGAGLAQRMAEASGMPVKKLGSRPGSLGSYAGVDRGIPIITMELPKLAHRESDDALWQKYGGALLAAVGYAGE